MNAVVQQILDSDTNEDAEKEVDWPTRVIDLTDEESAKKVQKLAKIPVNTNMLQKISSKALWKQQPSVGSTNVRVIFSQQSNQALSVIFVQAFLIRTFTDGERVDLI